MDKYDQVVGWITGNWVGALALLILAALAALPQVRDGTLLLWSWARRALARDNAGLDESPIVIDTGDERVTFTELLRSADYDVVKVHAHNHILGVGAEYKWIKRRYPKSERREQRLTTLDILSGKGKYKANQVHFDVVTIALPDGREKKIYFDISSFFGGGISTVLNPEGVLARKLAELYKL
ncbi:MAG: hypothetical protein AABY95_02885 [Pseudomonadota bacterium]